MQKQRRPGKRCGGGRGRHRRRIAGEVRPEDGPGGGGGGGGAVNGHPVKGGEGGGRGYGRRHSCHLPQKYFVN